MPSLHDRRFNSYFVHNLDGVIHEYAATKCAHGGEIIIQRPGVQDWDFCMKCQRPICLRCTQLALHLGGVCVVEERLLAAMETELRYPKVQRERAVLLDAKGYEASAAVLREQALLQLHREGIRE